MFLPARCMTPTYAACDGQELENLSARQYKGQYCSHGWPYSPRGETGKYDTKYRDEQNYIDR